MFYHLPRGVLIPAAATWAGAADPQVTEPMLRLFRRGIDDGTLRGDLPAETLLASYADLIEGSIIRSARTHAGVEENQRGHAQHLPERRPRHPRHASPRMTGLRGRSGTQFSF